MKLLKMTALTEKLSLSRRKIVEMVGNGEFPKPRQIGSRIAWIESEIDEWIEKLPEGESYSGQESGNNLTQYNRNKQTKMGA